MMLKITSRKSRLSETELNQRSRQNEKEFISHKPNTKYISINNPSLSSSNSNLATKKYSFDAVFTDGSSVVRN